MSNDTTLTAAWGADVFPQLSWFRQAKVQEARVMVVGCGALGNEVLKNLVLFGVEHLVIVDFDAVEPSNLSRSVFFTHDDAARHIYKVKAVARRLREINPRVEVQTICGDIAHDVGLGLIAAMDVAIGCVDNRFARYCLNRLCMRAGIPWVDGGIDGLEGTCRVFVPGKNCYACNLGPEGLDELRRRRSCADIIRQNETAGRAPTTPIAASVIAAVEVQEAMKLIHREEMERGLLTSLCGKMFYYEGQHLTTRLVGFQAYDDDCPVHERWAPTVCTPLTTHTTVAEALRLLSTMLQTDKPVVCLRDYSFVDYLTDRTTDERTEVMQPSFRVDDFLSRHAALRHLPSSRFYQHELPCLDAAFPYPALTLEEVGVPARDILQVSTPGGERYAEMAAE